MEDTTQPTQPAASSNKGANKTVIILLLVIAILLAAVLATNVYTTVTTNEQNQLAEDRAVAYQERVEAAQYILDTQRDVVFDLMSDYQDTAYGPSVDRIAEQQLTAEEFQLIALQIIAIQNSQVIELLAATP